MFQESKKDHVMIGGFNAAAQAISKKDASSPEALGRKLLAEIKKGGLLSDIIHMRSLLTRGAALDMADEEGTTHLMGAAMTGQLHISRIILSKHPKNIDAQDKYGNTALILAVYYGRKEIVDELLEAGASLAIKDKRGLTALDYARATGKKDLVERLEKEEQMRAAARKFSSKPALS